MKRYILLVISFLFVFYANSQTKYKDVFELIKHQSDNEAYQTLQEFSRQRNNSHSASLYKMGIILERRVANYDPFLQATAVERAIYDAELYFGLAKHNFDERIARQDGHFFTDVPKADKSSKAPTYQEISEDINKHLEAATKHKNYFLQNRENLYKAADKYNECIAIFNDICRTNAKLKDLYFLVDNQLQQRLELLQSDFDSTLFYLNELQKSLAEYPMLDYKFKYRLNPIEIYRMHGLTQANFLAQEIQLWDFSAWLKKFDNVRRSEVSFLYESVLSLDAQHAEYMQKLENKNDSAVPANYCISPYILNKIRKYDNTSLANLLLSYQQSQINYAQQLVSYKIDTSLLAFGANLPQSTYFDKSLKTKSEADSLLILFEKNINAEGIKKYSNLFNKKYNGEKGLQKYVKQQQEYNVGLFTKAVNDFSAHIQQFGQRDTVNNNVLVHTGDTLWAQVVAPNVTWGVGYFVNTKSVNARNETIIAGTYVGKRNERHGFVAKLDTACNILWLRILKNGDINRSCLFAEPINNDVVAILTTTSRAGAIRNFMVLLDDDGNVKQTTEIKVPQMPRKLIVDDISNNFIVAFSGTSNQKFVAENCDLQISCLDAKFKTIWNKTLKFNGYLVNILKNNNIYYLYGAFSKITSLDGEEINLDGSTAIFQYSIDAEGNWQNGEHYEFKQSVYPLWAAKIDNTRAEIIVKTEVESSQNQDDNESAYLQFSFDGNELYSTLK